MVGKKEGYYTIEDIQGRFLHCLCQDRISQTYVARLNQKIVGIYQLAMEDVDT